MASSSDVELRSVVKFCVALNKSPTETLKMIKSTGKYEKCSQAFVYKWHARFRSGRDSIMDDPRCGRPSSVKSSTVGKVRDLEDRRVTVRAIAGDLGFHALLCTVFLLTNLECQKLARVGCLVFSKITERNKGCDVLVHF